MVSGGNPTERPLENGDHCSSLGDTQKFKLRKVSTVGDFPQGCGQDAQLNDAQSQLSVDLAVSEEGDVLSSNAPAGSGTLVIEKSDGTETSVEPEIQSAKVLVKVLDNVDSLAQENLATPSSEADLIDREVLLKDDIVPIPKDKFCRRRVSATRDFPPCCGRNVPPMAEEENLHSPRKRGRVASSSYAMDTGGKSKKIKLVAKKNTIKPYSSRRPFLKKTCTDIKFPLLPSCSNSSHGEARSIVRETLHLFRTICKKLRREKKQNHCGKNQKD